MRVQSHALYLYFIDKTLKNKDSYFRFKNAELRNDRAAFKINTDGVLLAAWVDIRPEDKIFEIGTGTGVIPILLTSRYGNLDISCIELDDASYLEARFNIRHNGMNSIRLIHGDVKQFVTHNRISYDHIISNPPFFQNDTKPQNASLSVSKHSTLLDIEELCSVCNILTEKSNTARLSVILSLQSSILFEKIITNYGFSLKRLTRIKGTTDKPVIRCLMEFQRSFSGDIDECDLVLFEDKERTKTHAYDKLVSGFYL